MNSHVSQQDFSSEGSGHQKSSAQPKLRHANFSLIESNDMRMWQAQMHLDLTLKVSITKKVSLASDAKYCEMVTWGVLSQWIQYILNRQYTTKKQTNGGANGQRHAACNDIHTSNHIMLSLSMKPNKTRWCCVCVSRDVQVSSLSNAPEYHSATERSTNWMRSFLGHTIYIKSIRTSKNNLRN